MDRESEEWKCVHKLCMSIFLDGECYAFATAVHRSLGWPMMGLKHDGELRHVFLSPPESHAYFDARGFFAIEKIGIPFNISIPEEIVPVEEKELRRDKEPKEVREHSIHTARRYAEVLWPDLPWKESLMQRATAFADELEVLSRKHKLWIRSAIPSTPPLIAEGQDDEGGYSLVFTGGSPSALSISRYFPFEIKDGK
jgi:hypothetical protein